MPNEHALLSASGAARWLKCTKSARLEEQMPETTSIYAAEGTAAHEFAELAGKYFTDAISETEYEAKVEELSKGEYYYTCPLGTQAVCLYTDWPA